MILSKSVRIFHRTSTLHTLGGKKRGANKLRKIRSGHGMGKGPLEVDPGFILCFQVAVVQVMKPKSLE